MKVINKMRKALLILSVVLSLCVLLYVAMRTSFGRAEYISAGIASAWLFIFICANE